MASLGWLDVCTKGLKLVGPGVFGPTPEPALSRGCAGSVLRARQEWKRKHSQEQRQKEFMEIFQLQGQSCSIKCCDSKNMLGKEGFDI